MRRTLDRVVPVIEFVGLLGDRELLVRAVELWHDSVAVLFSEEPSPWTDEGDGQWNRDRVQMEDDAGTTYEFVSGGGTGNDAYADCHATFRPAVPPGVSALYLTFRARQGPDVTTVTVDLS